MIATRWGQAEQTDDAEIFGGLQTCPVHQDQP